MLGALIAWLLTKVGDGQYLKRSGRTFVGETPSSGPSLASTTPAAVSGAGTVGVGTTAARADHVHPATGLVATTGAQNVGGVKTFTDDPLLVKEANHTLKVADSTTADAAGGHLTVKAGTATAGNANGGNLVLQAGAKSGSGTVGEIQIGQTGASIIRIGSVLIPVIFDGNLTIESFYCAHQSSIGGIGDASAILALVSTTQGFLLPRMTEAQRDLISAPAEGLIVYNTTTHKLNLRVAAAWEVITST